MTARSSRDRILTFTSMLTAWRRISPGTQGPSDTRSLQTRDGNAPSAPPLAAFLRYFLGLGAVGFGGPIALAGSMQKALVETRRWISAEDYAEGLASAHFSPEPLAAHLALHPGPIRRAPLGSTPA